MPDLLVAIAVSKPKGLGGLSGIPDVFAEVVGWARRSNLDVVEVEDFSVPGAKVDGDGIIAKLDSGNILKGRNRVFVYFCGHGFFVNGEAGWVLSGGPNDWTSIVGVLKFRDMIASYGVENIAIWSDACQSLRIVRGGTTPMLRPGPMLDALPPTDLFYATREGNEAYIVREAERWRPVFSSVLVEALSASPPPEDALDQPYRLAGLLRITSQSMTKYLNAEVPQRASSFNLSQLPHNSPGILDPHNIYREVKPPVSAGAGLESLGGIEEGVLYGGASPIHEGPRQRPVRTEEPAAERGDFDMRTMSESRMAFWGSAQDLLAGKSARNAGTFVAHQGAGGMRRADIRRRTALGPETQLIDLGEGRWSLLPQYWGLVCFISVVPPSAESGAGGINAVGWSPGDASTRTDNIGFERDDDPMRLVKGLTTGALTRADMHRMLASYRADKHANPMLGIAAAYVYDGVGDRTAIRRMASYYVAHSQPIPFDVALLARLPFGDASGGGLAVDLPEVAMEPPPFAGAPAFMFEARPAAQRARVAGVCPVMRGGWRVMDFASGKDAAAKRLLAAVKRHQAALTDAPITTFRTVRGADDFRV